MLAFRGLVPSKEEGVSLDTIVVKKDAETKGKTVIFVHPYAIMGGCAAMLYRIASYVAEGGHTVVLMDLRGSGESTGSSTIFLSSEVEDVKGVIQWIHKHPEMFNTEEIVLFGSSAGGPVAGACLEEEGIVGGVFVGYTWGFFASILFGHLFNACKEAHVPKHFIMGSSDGFTTPSQLLHVLNTSKGRNTSKIVQDVGHFELEGPDYDRFQSEEILSFLEKL